MLNVFIKKRIKIKSGNQKKLMNLQENKNK